MVVLVVVDPLWGAGGSCVCSCKKGVRVCFDWVCYFREIVLGETSLVSFLIFLFFFTRATRRRAGIRHSGIWSELGRPLVWVAEVNRWAAGVIGNLLALERALRMRSERCEQHVKVGVQGSGFAWLVV